MASLPVAAALSPIRAAVLAATAAGLAAALLILWLVGSIVLAGGFFGAALVAAGATATYRLLAPARAATDAPGADWDLARNLAQASGDAVAVT